MATYRNVNQRWTRGFGGPTPHMPELKHFDTSTNNALTQSATFNNPGVVAAWSINYLFFPTQGADYTNRIGRKTIIDKLMLRLMLAVDQTVSVEANAGFVRCIVVYDQQNNSLNSTATTQAAALLQVPAVISSPLLLDNRERFLVLMDKFIFMGGVVNSAAGFNTLGSPMCAQKLLKFKSRMLKDVIFNGTNGGTNADVITGSIFLLMGTNIVGNNGGGVSPTVNVYSRIRWHDC